MAVIYLIYQSTTPLRGEYGGIMIFKWANNLIFLIAEYSKFRHYIKYGSLIDLKEFENQQVWMRPKKDPLLKILTSNQGLLIIYPL
jgi:hypothetical protein